MIACAGPNSRVRGQGFIENAADGLWVPQRRDPANLLTGVKRYEIGTGAAYF